MNRGLRNNNPLNIRRSNNNWMGRRTTVTDKDFEEFVSMPFGYRAAWKLLESYRLRFINEGKPFTLNNIVHRWAPPEDGNNTREYIHSVIRLTDYKTPGERPLPAPCSPAGYNVLCSILAAMTCVECGISMNQVDKISIRNGWDLAFGKLNKQT